jgi:DNA polymerase-3 subunit chi
LEIWFYHLQRQPLDKVLPTLLEKSLERGWRAIVQASPPRLKALDDLLWSYAPESFLPHSLEPSAETPIFLTSEAGNPNGARLRIFVDGEDPASALAEPYDRLIVMFDGNDEAQLGLARRQWSALKASGQTLAYWQQNESGGWEKKA